MHYLALQLPGGQTITAPAGVPQGGLAVTSKVIGNSITIMLIIAIILALVFLILGGIGWITSGGDKAKVAAARSRITYAIIGLVVTLVAFFIVSVVGYIFNVPLVGIN
jgi:predicted small integral membrane protein